MTNRLRAKYFRSEIRTRCCPTKCSDHVSFVTAIIFCLICVCWLVLEISNHPSPYSVEQLRASVCPVYVAFHREVALRAVKFHTVSWTAGARRAARASLPWRLWDLRKFNYKILIS